MARERSSAPARWNGSPLVASLLVPIAVLIAILAVAVAIVATSGGRRAADKELDARAVSVKKAWDAVGQPTRQADVALLGKRLGAKLRVVRGNHPAAGATKGDVRAYAFGSRKGRTLRIALSTKASTDSLSSGRMGAIAAGLVGLAVLLVLAAALLRSIVSAPLRGFSSALQRLQRGEVDARAPEK